MMNYKVFTIFFFIVLGIGSVNAQNRSKRCHTTEYQQHLYQKHPHLKKQAEALEDIIQKKSIERKQRPRTQPESDTDDNILTIPVVVHVIHNNPDNVIGGDNNGNISDEQILSQIEVLNEDFRRIPNTPGYNEHPVGADTRIQFCLATRDPQNRPTNGIVRVFNQRRSYSFNDTELLSSLSYWPSSQYLNIWVTRLTGDILGFAQFPHGSGLPGLGSIDEGAATDGVFINWPNFGRGGRAPYDMGRTTTHEVGHWLGLRHIWGDERCGNDYVEDTPRHEDANYDCPSFSDCERTGVETQDMTENYLDYTDDECMNLFTKGQTERMRTVLSTSPRRASLRYSIGCCGDDATLPAPYATGFDDDTFFEEGWRTVHHSGPSNTEWEQVVQGAYELSNGSISIDNTAETVGSVHFLKAPFLNFEGVTNPVMDFDLAYAGNPAGETDTLVLSYSPNCFNWFPIKTFYGDQLTTTERTTTEFVPQQNEWQKIRIPLNELMNRRILQFRFENRSAGANRVYIDNLNIYQTTPFLTVKMYPNPTSDLLFAEVLFEGNQDISFEVFNVMGQKINEWTDKNQNSFVKQIDTYSLSQGVYIFRINSSQGDTVQKKVVINK
ncbi:T9SS type A sorting domain-containing protein [Cytophagaceae bacterium ABcell3]|nr:T9SS type A sorting domain-containing protein [Cytophagaceae bacterium ABcell3]